MLLRALAASPRPRGGPGGSRAEPWFGLWSALCHQGDVYAASYAALPHVVEIARTTMGPVDFSCFQLPAAIEVARRTGRGPEIPPELADAYHVAIAQLMEAVSLHRDDPWDEDLLLSAAAAQAVAKGHIAAAEALLNLDADWIGKINRSEIG